MRALVSYEDSRVLEFCDAVDINLNMSTSTAGAWNALFLTLSASSSLTPL